MRCKKLVFMTAVAWFVATCAMAASAKTMYVQVPSAEIRDGKTPGSAVIAEIEQGTKLTVLGEEGVRFSVQLEDGRKGYISKLAVAAEKPSSGGLGGLAMTDDRDINERRSAASGRGLSEAAKTMAKNGAADPNAIAWVEAMEKLAKKITASDVKKFRKEGGL